MLLKVAVTPRRPLFPGGAVGPRARWLGGSVP